MKMPEMPEVPELPPLPPLDAMTGRVEVWGLMQDYARLAVKQERERCAKLCETAAKHYGTHASYTPQRNAVLDCAAAIRAKE